jgi:hypothetical protein
VFRVTGKTPLIILIDEPWWEKTLVQREISSFTLSRAKPKSKADLANGRQQDM